MQQHSKLSTPNNTDPLLLSLNPSLSTVVTNSQAPALRHQSVTAVHSSCTMPQQLSLLSLLHYGTALRHQSVSVSVLLFQARCRLVSLPLPHSPALLPARFSRRCSLLGSIHQNTAPPRNVFNGHVSSERCPLGLMSPRNKVPLGIESYTESCLLGLLVRRNDVSSE